MNQRRVVWILLVIFVVLLAFSGSVEAAGDQVLYAIKPGGGDLLVYDYTETAKPPNQWSQPVTIGNGWFYKQVVSGGNGVLFAITEAGDLFYFKFLGLRNGKPVWANPKGQKIGNGWIFRGVFSNGKGGIFAITDNYDLMYYRYLGMNDGSNNWSGAPVKVGNGWKYRRVFAGDNGAILAVTDSGDLLYYKFGGVTPPTAAQASTGIWPVSAVRIGNGWNFRDVFAGQGGAIFAVKENGDLLFYKLLSVTNNTGNWAPDPGKQVGNGWNFSHLLADVSAFSGGVMPAAAPANSPGTPSTYRTTQWSAWVNQDGVAYHYFFGWDSKAPFLATVDVTFTVHNPQSVRWEGEAQALDCKRGTPSVTAQVTLKPGETHDFKLKAPNCGDREAPFFKPKMHKSGTIDRG
jgi:hypothetical protein